MDIDGPRCPVIVVPPDGIEQGAPCQDSATMMTQMLEQSELLRSQGDVLFLAAHFMFRDIQEQWAIP